MARDEAVADRSAVVLHVHPHRTGEADLVQQPVDDVGEVVEGVVPFGWVGHVGVAEPGVVGREHVEAVGQRGDQVPELVRGGGKAAKQEQLGARGIAGPAVENGKSVDLGSLSGDHEAPLGGPCGGCLWVTGDMRPGKRGSYVGFRLGPLGAGRAPRISWSS
jgi:hypothetical protein